MKKIAVIIVSIFTFCFVSLMAVLGTAAFLSGESVVSSGAVVAAPAAQAVTIQNFAFSPASLTVAAGTMVTWTNNDTTAHTVTADSGSGPNSGNIAPGQTYSFTFQQAGTVAYHCTIHPTMKATVVVTSSTTTTPPPAQGGSGSSSTPSQPSSGGTKQQPSTTTMGGMGAGSSATTPSQPTTTGGGEGGSSGAIAVGPVAAGGGSLAAARHQDAALAAIGAALLAAVAAFVLALRRVLPLHKR